MGSACFKDSNATKPPQPKKKKMRLEPTAAEQRQLDGLFWSFLSGSGSVHRYYLSDVVLFAHRVADGTAIRRIRDGASFSLPGLSEFITGERNQDISAVAFDITVFPNRHVSCMYKWVNAAVFMINQVLDFPARYHGSKHHVQLEQDCDASFELLRRSGGVTTDKVGFNALSLATRCPYTMRKLLNEPTLRDGWNLCHKPAEISAQGNEGPLLSTATPLVQSLVDSNQEKEENEQLRPKLIDIMTDEGINAFNPETHDALWWSIRFKKLATLRALLLRPNLDMTRPCTDAFVGFPRTDICERQRVLGVFDEVANHFAVLPIMMHQIILDRYGIVIPHPVCQIVAEYYRMPYPVSFYSNAKVSTIAQQQSAATAAAAPAALTIHEQPNTVHPILGCFYEW